MLGIRDRVLGSKELRKQRTLTLVEPSLSGELNLHQLDLGVPLLRVHTCHFQLGLTSATVHERFRQRLLHPDVLKCVMGSSTFRVLDQEGCAARHAA